MDGGRLANNDEVEAGGDSSKSATDADDDDAAVVVVVVAVELSKEEAEVAAERRPISASLSSMALSARAFLLSTVDGAARIDDEVEGFTSRVSGKDPAPAPSLPPALLPLDSDDVLSSAPGVV